MPQRALADAGDGMKKFATELRGKTVMTNDGQMPRKGIKTDPEGRLILPFQGMRAVKDVVVMNL